MVGRLKILRYIGLRLLVPSPETEGTVGTSKSRSISTLKKLSFFFRGTWENLQILKANPDPLYFFSLLLRYMMCLAGWQSHWNTWDISAPGVLVVSSKRRQILQTKRSKAARRHDTGLGQLYGWCCFPNWKHDPHNDLERRNIHYDDYPGSVVTSCDFILWAMSYEWGA